MTQKQGNMPMKSLLILDGVALLMTDPPRGNSSTKLERFAKAIFYIKINLEQFMQF